jgi:hypothetical protein
VANVQDEETSRRRVSAFKIIDEDLAGAGLTRCCILEIGMLLEI